MMEKDLMEHYDMVNQFNHNIRWTSESSGQAKTNKVIRIDKISNEILKNANPSPPYQPQYHQRVTWSEQHIVLV